MMEWLLMERPLGDEKNLCSTWSDWSLNLILCWSITTRVLRIIGYTMRSGLKSTFSRPRKTNGATTERAGGFQTPMEKYAGFPSPAVRSNLWRACFHGTHHANSLFDTQVRTARQIRRPTSPASSARPSLLSGGGRGGNGIVARKQNPPG